jgi:hypothetical protein
MWTLLFAVAALASPLEVGGGKIDVAFETFLRAASDAEVRAFVERSAAPVAAYYGKFPVPRLRVRVIPNRSAGGLFGREFHGRRIDLYLGSAMKAADFPGEHMLTHEMFHLGFPDLAGEYAWVEEGLATYLAHLARARAGQTTEAEFWRIAFHGFSDAISTGVGFASETNYRAMYWGGAFFWFSLDLEIRERSKGARSLDTVTRAILRAGGTNAHEWSLVRLRGAVDRAAGFAVFQKWYDRLGRRPGHVDLAELGKNLGVELSDHDAVLREDAPLASTRHALFKNLP